jgi:hypothetical protein
MKVAILLTGQLRTFDLVKYFHMNALIKKYNADVFLGIDINNKYQCEYENPTSDTDLQDVEKAKDFFKPIDTFILNEYDYFQGRYEHLLFRQYYVVKNTYQMLKTHSDANHITYDLIIRLRFDYYIFTKELPILPEILDTRLNTVLYNKTNIDILKNHIFDKTITFEEIIDNTIYVVGVGDFKHYKYANDPFFYHNHSLLEKMLEFYDHMTPIMEYCSKNNIGQNGAMIECVFYMYLTHFNNINLKITNIRGIVIRDFRS